MKEQINEQLALLEKELSRLKKVTDYIDDTKETAQVVISKLKEVQKNYSTYTKKIFDLYKTSVEQLKRETELQIMEGVIHFETTGSKIDQTNKEIQENYSTYTEKIFDLHKTNVEQLKRKTESQIKEGVGHFKATSSNIDQTNKEIQENYSTYTKKIFDLYKTSVEQLKRETELQIMEGVIHFETTGSKIDQTNREKLVETKRLLENYKKTVEATDNLVKTLESVDFPTRLDEIELKISKNLEEFSQRFDLHDKQNKIIKTLLFVISGLIVIGVILLY